MHKNGLISGRAPIGAENHLPNPLLTFSSLRPKFSPFDVPLHLSHSASPEIHFSPLVSVCFLLRVLCLCLSAGNMFSLHPDLVRAAGRRSACGEISLRSCSRQTHGTHRSAPLRSGPDRPSAAAQSTPDRPGDTTSQPTCGRSPTSDRWTTVLSVKNVTRVTLGPRS